MNKGIFWLIENELFCLKIPCDKNGTPLNPETAFSAKSGDNFNHKAEWEKLSKKVTRGKPFNYYPRGRVEIKNGKVTIYLNPYLNKEKIINALCKEFSILSLPIKVKNDGSAHYNFLMNID